MKPLLLLSVVLFAACSQQQESPAVMTPPPFYTPSAAIMQSNHPNGPLQSLALNPGNVLPSSDDAYDFPRYEKTAYGAYSGGGASSFFIYTYDSQRISLPGGSGYVNRQLFQQGVSFP